MKRFNTCAFQAHIHGFEFRSLHHQKNSKGEYNMNEELKNAYKLVAEDLHSSGCDLFVGKYDTKNGNLHFLFGIQTILEYIWNKGLSEENASKY